MGDCPSTGNYPTPPQGVILQEFIPWDAIIWEVSQRAAEPGSMCGRQPHGPTQPPRTILALRPMPLINYLYT